MFCQRGALWPQSKKPSILLQQCSANRNQQHPKLRQKRLKSLHSRHNHIISSSHWVMRWARFSIFIPFLTNLTRFRVAWFFNLHWWCLVESRLWTLFSFFGCKRSCPETEKKLSKWTCTTLEFAVSKFFGQPFSGVSINSQTVRMYENGWRNAVKWRQRKERQAAINCRTCKK